MTTYIDRMNAVIVAMKVTGRTEHMKLAYLTLSAIRNRDYSSAHQQRIVGGWEQWLKAEANS